MIVESESAVSEWKKDSSIPLTQVVDAFQVFVGQGAQGILDRPSKQQLENEVSLSPPHPFHSFCRPFNRWLDVQSDSGGLDKSENEGLTVIVWDQE